MTDIMSRISAAAAALVAAMEEEKNATDEATRAKARVDDLKSKVIPDLMAEANVRSLVTDEGLHVSVSEKVRTNTKNPALHEWLRKTNNGGLIKTVVTVPFAKGGDDAARALVAKLAKDEIAATNESDVAWNSLQTLVRDMLKAGDEVPLAALNIHLMPEAKVVLK